MSKVAVKQTISSSIQPLFDNVLIRPDEAVSKTSTGIYLPDSAKEKPQVGKVVLVGSPKKDEPMEIKIGDTVFYGKYSGTELSIDGTDYLLMSQTDVLFVAE